ncbi:MULTISPECIES: betaine/proline/choline family ABC transporter ATP-binding protein [Mesotoga]|uniref:betaine/proline/choline family ABC transporter ATP-binding protein n=1 Tax=Mesotoga TaxID=1184396 RepID=UPI0002C8B18D|nr:MULTISPECIES: betaine/proline/choline family ABC transporter ATP-binding protein [Mesotoga]MCP5456473.1 betaine/proline/choline family ABC transporter ATP-binding protein [Thermotogota bacterium]CCU85737.1 Glycine betaine/carnitine/choline transport ATP-binding protein OpuCA [Mesotoga infera]MCB1222589.1 betaine/proline/choline family ABC transporter ATP-binding protein [Mesotoga sp.]MCP5460434.1 betaine/proline/choline family ABC transporter ATP-binding protein [Thermotogota bacterium]MDK2
MSIEFKNVVKEYEEGFKAVDNLSITFEDKELTILIGPSGCGKTTTLKMINRLIEKTDGEIVVDGTSLDEIDPIRLRRSIGYVIQEIGLFPHMTVFDNIAVTPRLMKWDETRIKKHVFELLDLVNLEPSDYAEKYPAQLSGGQRQRVGVARGLASDPKIVLMDEPFGAIDPINREKLQDGFLEIQSKIEKTIIFVTHDIREAIKLGDKIAILDDGKLVQYADTMTVVQEPANEFVEDLLGADRALKGLELVRVRETYVPGGKWIEDTGDCKVKKAKDFLIDEGRKFAYVVDGSKRLKGYVMLKQLNKASDEEPLKKYLRSIETIQPLSNLMEAMSLIMNTGLSSLPVVDDKERLLGTLRFKDLVNLVGSYESSDEE